MKSGLWGPEQLFALKKVFNRLDLLAQKLLLIVIVL